MYKQNTSLASKFPIGGKVEAIERLRAGSWAAGEKLKADKININYGIIEEFNEHSTKPQIKIRLTGGHLFDSSYYKYPHVWHEIEESDQFSTRLIETQEV